jgi:hypothetical protein
MGEKRKHEGEGEKRKHEGSSSRYIGVCWHKGSSS